MDFNTWMDRLDNECYSVSGGLSILDNPEGTYRAVSAYEKDSSEESLNELVDAWYAELKKENPESFV